MTIHRQPPVSGIRLPPFEGLRIGLYGGSFNPAHAAHFAIGLEALKRLGLDAVWWLVSPQNPLKDPAQTGGFESRLAGARRIARHPRLHVLDTEQQLATRTTAQTLHALRPVIARGSFVWIMGADSFAGLHRWHDWSEIPQTLPLAVFDRPGWTLKALTSPAARRYSACRLDSSDSQWLVNSAAPAWCFLKIPLNAESSTAIRNRPGANGP